MFATTGGTVSRNKLSDFVDVRRSGIIAMKLGRANRSSTCRSHRARRRAADGRRRPVHPLPRHRCARVRGRSMGVRGIALADNDTLISLAILRHVETTSDERSAYLKMRHAVAGETAPEETAEAETEEASTAIQLSSNAMSDVGAGAGRADGLRQRLRQAYSSYEYRTTGRGGKGIVAMSVNNRNGKLGVIPVEHSDQIMLVTDKAS
jgi:DNA gyrase subunit A